MIFVAGYEPSDIPLLSAAHHFAQPVKL